MDRNTRSIIPPSMNHVKPRNGPISPRERDMNSSYSNHQPPHYNNYNNNSSVSPNNQQHQPQQPNSDLINFVQGAWKEKMSAEVFKPENTDKLNHFDFDGWLRTRQH